MDYYCYFIIVINDTARNILGYVYFATCTEVSVDSRRHPLPTSLDEPSSFPIYTLYRNVKEFSIINNPYNFHFCQSDLCSSISL